MELLMMVGCMLTLGVCICYCVSKWNDIRYNRKGLPQGTMGWPLLGETSEFLKQGPDFMKNRRARYGSVFKSHILGCPTIVSMDSELNRYILLNEGKGLVPGYPQSTLDILGEHNMGALHGPDHKRTRGSLLSLTNPAVLKDQLLPKMDKYMRIHLDDLDGKTIDIQKLATDMAFLISFKQIMESESTSTYEAFRKEFGKLVTGTLSLPINIPGTNYYRGIQGRKRIIKMLREIMKKRMKSLTDDDMLDYLLMEEDPRYKLNNEEILDQIIMILNSGYETVSVTSMMAIKYLHDHPKALEELREEHFSIRAMKMPEDPLDWNDYKSMTFTRAVIYETSRLATIVNGLLRKTINELELNGFVIPKGWRIYVYFRETNFDPFLYPEPFTFNPWRWLDKGMESHNFCFLFGGGTRLCPGKELGIATVSTFIHYFVTRYRWEEVVGEEIQKFPRVQAPNGLHVKVSKY